jgi:hypothetical protein
VARNDSATSAVAVNLAGADVPFNEPMLSVFVGGAGNLKVDMADGTTVTFTGVAAGTLLPIQVKKIYAAANGTTATNIVVLNI